jgi:cell division protein FtsB
MIESKKLRLISGTQFIAIVVLTISIFLIVDFSRRTRTGYYVSQAEQRLQEEIAIELTQQADLQARLQELQSDEYVEEWARKEAHMIRPGDRPFMLMTPESPQVRVELVQQAPPLPEQALPNWVQWWVLFFDSTPPLR